VAFDRSPPENYSPRLAGTRGAIRQPALSVSLHTHCVKVDTSILAIN